MFQVNLKQAALVNLVSLAFLGFNAAKSEPNEKTSETITRTATKKDPFNFTLSKNIYRTESYQAEYSVQVPYEETESYWEDVPYEDTEWYTDY